MENKNKKEKKKPAKEASNIFHNIMAASVKDNPKPAPKKAATPKAKREVIALNDVYRITRFTIMPHSNSELALRSDIEKYVSVMSGYTVFKEYDNPFSAIVVEVLKK